MQSSMTRLRSALCSLAVALPAAAHAHPHVFADTSYVLGFDADGRLASIRTTCRYDELFTLLLI